MKNIEKIKIKEDFSKYFTELADPNWISDSERREKLSQELTDSENQQKMKFVRSHKNPSMSGMRKPKGIEEWCD